MRHIALFLIRCYKLFLSPVLGNNCRFNPSCSTYARQAFETYGFLRGMGLTLRRLARCHPWSEGGDDPLPPINQNNKG
jgi:putative membrane protein insertion efficiency factor